MQFLSGTRKVTRGGYYVVRVLQRISVFMAVLTTGIYVVFCTNMAMNLPFAQQNTYYELRDPDAFQRTADRASDLLVQSAASWIVISFVITLSMLTIARVRLHEKRLVVDSFAILLCCVGTVILYQPALRAFINQLV